jgi:hypothetical protein
MISMYVFTKKKYISMYIYPLYRIHNTSPVSVYYALDKRECDCIAFKGSVGSRPILVLQWLCWGLRTRYYTKIRVVADVAIKCLMKQSCSIVVTHYTIFFHIFILFNIISINELIREA